MTSCVLSFGLIPIRQDFPIFFQQISVAMNAAMAIASTIHRIATAKGMD